MSGILAQVGRSASPLASRSHPGGIFGPTTDRPPHTVLMKSRLFSVLGTLSLIAVFGFGAFLLAKAEDMPAPGLILMLVSGVFLLNQWKGRRGIRTIHSAPGSPFTGLDQARESYEYELERHRRGDFDDAHTSNR